MTEAELTNYDSLASELNFALTGYKNLKNTIENCMSEIIKHYESEVVMNNFSFDIFRRFE